MWWVAVTEQALTRIEIFTEGGLQVVANSPIVPTVYASNYRDFEVGTKHRVWGWKAAIRKATIGLPLADLVEQNEANGPDVCAPQAHGTAR